jgi:transposase-like protein
MTIPTIECTSCGSNNVRLARYNGAVERINAFFGFQPFRCRDCRHRFTTSIWLLGNLAYAKCPKCLGMNLVHWSKKHYKPHFYKNFLISMGAQRYRCPGCRCNFVSFRPRNRMTTHEEPERPQIAPEPAPVQEATGSEIPAEAVQTSGAGAVEKDSA